MPKHMGADFDRRQRRWYHLQARDGGKILQDSAGQSGDQIGLCHHEREPSGTRQYDRNAAGEAPRGQDRIDETGPFAVRVDLNMSGIDRMIGPRE